MTTLAALVTTARTNAGITQAELARKLGVSKQYLSRIEHGGDTGISNDTIEGLAATLGIPADTLYHAARRLPPDIADALFADSESFARIRRMLRRRKG